MKYISIIFLLIILDSCSSREEISSSQTIETPEVNQNEQVIMVDSISVTPPQEQAEHQDDDCIFNNDYYGLTTEWAAESGFTDYRWDSLNNQLLIPYKKDTIAISKGGCYHFEFSAELRLYKDTTTITNSKRWIELSLVVAEQLGFKHYQKALNEIKAPSISENTREFFIDILDDNLEDNYFYTGVKVEFKELFRSITIGKYVN